jgi:hypothetical protein
MVMIGPFEFSAKGSRLTFHGDRQLLSSLPTEWLDFLKNGVAHMSHQMVGVGGVQPKKFRGWGPAAVAFGVSQGLLPIAKATNPYEDGNWGIYVNIADDRILWMEYKQIEPSVVNKVGAGLLAIGKAIIDAARALCGATQADISKLAIEASDSKPIKTGAALCNLLFPQTVEETEAEETVEETVLPRSLAERLPVGSIQAKLPSGQWAYAVPKGMVAALEGFGASPYAPFIRPRTANQQDTWHHIKTADSPYLTTWGIAQAFEKVGTGDEESTIAATIDLKTFNSQTTPFYKKWWFWATIGSVTAFSAGGYYMYRRRA